MLLELRRFQNKGVFIIYVRGAGKLELAHGKLLATHRHTTESVDYTCISFGVECRYTNMQDIDLLAAMLQTADKIPICRIKPVFLCNILKSKLNLQPF